MIRNNRVGQIVLYSIACFTFIAFAKSMECNGVRNDRIHKPEDFTLQEIGQLVLDTLAITNIEKIVHLSQNDIFLKTWTQHRIYSDYIVGDTPDEERNELCLILADCFKHNCREYSSTLWFKKRDRFSRMMLLAYTLRPLEVSRGTFLIFYNGWITLFNKNEKRERQEELDWVMSNREELSKRMTSLIKLFYERQGR